MTFLFCFKEQKRHCHKYRILVSWFNLSQKIQKMENITAQFATFSRTWQARVLKTTSRPFTFHQAFHISVHCVHWHLTAKSNWIIIKPLNTNKKWIPNFLLLCICLIFLDSITDPSQLLQFVRKDEKDGRFYCTICEDYSHTTKHWTRNHIEAKHFPDNFVYKCDQCSEVFKNAIGLNNHRARKHKNSSLINLKSLLNN